MLFAQGASRRSGMTRYRRSTDDARSTREHTTAETAGARWSEEPLRGARDGVEEEVLAWIAELTAARTALGLDFGSPKNRRLTEARDRFDRLEQGLALAPGQIGG